METRKYAIPKAKWELFNQFCELNSIKIISTYPKDDFFGDVFLHAIIKLDNSGEITKEEKSEKLKEWDEHFKK